MRDIFCDHFHVDKNVIIADLRALIIKDYNVEAFTTKFKALSAKFSMTPAKE